MNKNQSAKRNEQIPDFLMGGGEMGERIRSYDWSATSLGPIHTWPQSLRTCIRIMLTSRQPIWIGWGKELIKFYNDPYQAIVGGKHPWALGKPASLVWKDIWKEIGPMLKQVMEDDEGTYAESQLLIMHRNGYPEETYYTFSYTPIPGDHGGTGGMICANTDDTDRIISERQLRTLSLLAKNLANNQNNEEIILHTIESLQHNAYDFPFALFYSVTDRKAVLEHATELGNSQEQVPASIDLHGSDTLSSAIREAIAKKELVLLDNLKEVMGNMPTGAWEVSPNKAIVLPIMQAGSKEPYGLLIMGFNPYRLFDEKLSSFIGLIADQVATSFADVHALEEERKRAEGLAEIDRAKTTFFSNISHEFRTPLTLLLGPIEDALNDPDIPDENRTRMEVAYRNALRMQKLVNTLLEFSRIEAGRMEGRFRRVDLGTITADLASTFRSAIEKAGMALHINQEPISDDVYVDVDMWERIILNLLSNAFKYSKAGIINVSVRQEGGHVIVTVSDTGIGIPADQLDKIFNRFHRVENTSGRSQEGTGIGLAMVKELVKLHQGSIEVMSTFGKGSTFTVSIPVGKAHLPADKIDERAAAGPVYSHSTAFVKEAMKWLPDEARQQGSHEAANGKYTVLLADDNADMRDYVQRLLSDHFNVITAVDGEDAYEKAIVHKPDLLLSDIMMPKLDGLGLLKKLRSHAMLKHIPLILLSARAGEEAKVEGLDAGADDYLVKPFSARELIVRVGNHIRISQIRRDTEQQFYRLFLQAPAIINVFRGPDFVFEFFHPKNKEIFGDVDFTGMPLRKAVPQLEGQGVFEWMEEVYHKGITIHRNERPVTLLNEKQEPFTRYYHFTCQPWYDARGKIQGVINFSIDVTEAVESRKNIEESENRFRMLAETLPQLVWMTDDKGKQLYASSRWEEYTGLKPSRKNWPLIVHPDDLEPMEKSWKKSMASGKYYRIEARLRNRDGEYHWFVGMGEPIRDPQDHIIKWIGSFTDVQDQKEIESRLERLVTDRTLELQRSNEDLQQFAHVASHDLKEPVRKIKTFSGRLQHEFGNLIPDKGKVFLDKIQGATDRMYSMIDGVLNYSTLNASEQSIERVNLDDTIRHIETDLELSIQQKKGVLHHGRLPEIEGAAVLIFQLFYNLVNNSLKFSREGIPPVIDISGELVEQGGRQFAKIIFSDNGIGFDQEHATRIFNTFTRLHSKDAYEGTGLGLALCKKIVERHHGSITATAEKNKGATFTIMLPVKQHVKWI